MKCWLSKLLLLGVGLLTSQWALADWSLTQIAEEDRYRSATVSMEGLNLTEADSIQLSLIGETVTKFSIAAGASFLILSVTCWRAMSGHSIPVWSVARKRRLTRRARYSLIAMQRRPTA